MQVRSLVQEDPLEKKMAIHSSILAWEIPWTEEPGWQGMRLLNSITDAMDMNLSKLWETVKDREFWRAAVHGVAKSQTRLSNRKTATTIRR